MLDYMERCDELEQMLRNMGNTYEEKTFINHEIEHILCKSGFLNTLIIKIHTDLLQLFNQLSHQNLEW